MDEAAVPRRDTSRLWMEVRGSRSKRTRVKYCQAATAWFRVSRTSPDVIARLQDRRLRVLLRHVVAHSAFYRDKNCGIDIERCALSDLPTTTKAEMMERFDDLVTDPEVRRAEFERFVAADANAASCSSVSIPSVTRRGVSANRCWSCRTFIRPSCCSTFR